MQIKWFNQGRSLGPNDDFFLPELCLPEALLGLVLLAELLVLVLVLAEPMHEGFNWVRLALTSLFVQWIVLLSAALFCRLRPWLARVSPVLAGNTAFDLYLQRPADERPSVITITVNAVVLPRIGHELRDSLSACRAFCNWIETALRVNLSGK